jgi:hypothetical protein
MARVFAFRVIRAYLMTALYSTDHAPISLLLFAAGGLRGRSRNSRSRSLNMVHQILHCRKCITHHRLPSRYLFRRIEQRLDGSPTLVLLDEAWSYVRHELFRAPVTVKAAQYFLGVSTQTWLLGGAKADSPAAAGLSASKKVVEYALALFFRMLLTEPLAYA